MYPLRKTYSSLSLLNVREQWLHFVPSAPPLLLYRYFHPLLSLLTCRIFCLSRVSSSIDASSTEELFTLLFFFIPAIKPFTAMALALLDWLGPFLQGVCQILLLDWFGSKSALQSRAWSSTVAPNSMASLSPWLILSKSITALFLFTRALLGPPDPLLKVLCKFPCYCCCHPLLKVAVHKPPLLLL